MSWRPCPFEIGHFYSVMKPFKSLQFEFSPGVKLVFVGEGYSRYDSMTVYKFRSVESEQNYQWWLHDDTPLDAWKEHFKPDLK
jgi:hypothetical protein